MGQIVSHYPGYPSQGSQGSVPGWKQAEGKRSHHQGKPRTTGHLSVQLGLVNPLVPITGNHRGSRFQKPGTAMTTAPCLRGSRRMRPSPPCFQSPRRRVLICLLLCHCHRDVLRHTWSPYEERPKQGLDVSAQSLCTHCREMTRTDPLCSQPTCFSITLTAHLNSDTTICTQEQRPQAKQLTGP